MRVPLPNLALLAAVIIVVLGAGVGNATAADEFDRYGVESASASLSTTQAGAHPDLTLTFALTQKFEGSQPRPYARTRDVEVALPPGLMGNPQALPRCTVSQLGNLPEESECPLASQVGVTEVTLGEDFKGTFTEPIYNMEAPGGDVVARLGFFAVGYPTFINVRINPIDYSLVASIEGAPSGAGLLAAATTLWGVPASSDHDLLRLTPNEAKQHEAPPARTAGLPPVPFLTNPTDCTLERQISITARSYQLPGAPSTETVAFPEITGCGKLTFEPSFTVLPANPEAAAPTGLDARLSIPQDETAGGLATSALKSARVTLPDGFTINPAAADGLAACSAEQVGLGRNISSGCPPAAQIGSVQFDVPVLEEPLQGTLYQRTPEPGHLFRFWLVSDEQGVHLKLPAEIEASPETGRLATVFPGIASLGGNPQVPLSSLEMHIFGGPRAPLSTPTNCGTFQTHYEFSPWSGKLATAGATPMQITSGCGKGGFAPRVSAGMLRLRAGSFAPFTFTLSRQDGEANLQVLSVDLPEGLLAKLGGVPLCSDAAAAIGACPSGSRVGSLTVAVGVGGSPLWLPQPDKAATAVYLAGPYKNAPYSLVTVVPAQAGPFDLGTVVNRASLRVDPVTAQATIATDPLPQILQGVPVGYRTIHVAIDRPHFTLNPTGCGKKTIPFRVTAVNGAVASPQDEFQATNCTKLGYKPKLKLAFNGSTKRGGNPGVRAVLSQKAGQANTASATVILPASEFIDQSHINNPCTRVQFNADACPRKSVLGRATAVTPLLEEPLKGLVYLRSNGGARELPDIVADLHGPIDITLIGFVDSVRQKGPESSRVRARFASVPDAPVTRFTMNLFGGARGLLEHNTDLCKHPRRAKIVLDAQNGRTRSLHQPVATDCR